jgi:hypothetical protein
LQPAAAATSAFGAPAAGGGLFGQAAPVAGGGMFGQAASPGMMGGMAVVATGTKQYPFRVFEEQVKAPIETRLV